jgi:hypothetical protein
VSVNGRPSWPAPVLIFGPTLFGVAARRYFAPTMAWFVAARVVWASRGVGIMVSRASW